MIGKEAMRLSLIKSLQILKSDNGNSLHNFIKNAQCFKQSMWQVCETLDLDNNKIKKIFNGEELNFEPFVETGTEVRFLLLSLIRENTIEGVIHQINKYFPESSLEMFDVLDPNNLPTESREVVKFCKSIKPLAERFEVDPTAANVQFQNLLNFFISEFPDTYCSAKEKLDAVEFWVHLMNYESIPW